MRTPQIPILIAGLALWAAQACAQSSQPAYSADGLYNLANSYARAGKPGLAVLSYERAALLAPDDPDINANLAYVRTSTCAHEAARPFCTTRPGHEPHHSGLARSLRACSCRDRTGGKEGYAAL